MSEVGAGGGGGGEKEKKKKRRNEFRGCYSFSSWGKIIHRETLFIANDFIEKKNKFHREFNLPQKKGSSL